MDVGVQNIKQGELHFTHPHVYYAQRNHLDILV